MHDDTHKRWDNKSDERDKATWQYFDRTVAAAIVREALESPDLTLKRLYDALAYARKKCEWVKEQKPAGLEDIVYLAKCAVPHSYNSDFGKKSDRFSLDHNIFDEKKFGAHVVALADCRLGHLSRVIRKLGLSTYSFTDAGSIFHPQFNEGAWEKAESYFQNMRLSTTLFDFFKHASDFMYLFSVSWPLARGTAAVNSWILQYIFNEKFDATTPIRPMLYDWVAFFETPLHYSQFFIISSIVNYLKSIPAIYEKNRAFYDAVLAELMKDPSHPANQNIRKNLWENILSHISDTLDNSSIQLIEAERKNLQSFYKSNLIFKNPSAIIETFLVDRKMAHENRDYLARLLHLHANMVEIFLTAPEPHDFVQLCVDVERLRTLDDTELDELATLCGIQRSPQHKTASKKPSEIETLLLESHGMEEEEIGLFDFKQLQALCCNAAILLYNANKFIYAKDLIKDTPLETQRNILKCLAKTICKENNDELYRKIERLDEETLSFLLELETLFNPIPVKISELIGSTSEDTMRNAMQFVVTKAYDEPEAEGLFRNASKEQLQNYCEHLSSIEQRGGKQGFACSILSVQKMLSTYGLKMHALIQLSNKDATNLLLAYKCGQTSDAKALAIKSAYDKYLISAGFSTTLDAAPHQSQ